MKADAFIVYFSFLFWNVIKNNSFTSATPSLRIPETENTVQSASEDGFHDDDEELIHGYYDDDEQEDDIYHVDLEDKSESEERDYFEKYYDYDDDDLDADGFNEVE